MIDLSDTIAAVSTPYGTGGIAIIRVSGPEAISVIDKAWRGASLHSAKSHSIHLGKYISIQNNILDEALVSIFRNPNSFTGEDVIEISLHGSKWIQREVMADLVLRGIRPAQPGEFTMRAFLNGKLDLTQAEGVADMIASSSHASQKLAISQMKGTFSIKFETLRQKLIEIASLLELELDFSEEEVEFANRLQLINLIDEIISSIESLISSYSAGKVIKEGFPVAIAGIPNAGKSSLLNLLLQDDKAIVTSIPGTTRDVIEESIELNGRLFRLFDTAGLRDTTDSIEILGIERTKKSIKKAYILLWMIDVTSEISPQIKLLENELSFIFAGEKEDECLKNVIILLNKTDILRPDYKELKKYLDTSDLNKQHSLKIETIEFSTVTAEGLNKLEKYLCEFSETQSTDDKVIITNSRHYEALVKSRDSLQRVKEGLKSGLTTDLISQDLRESIHHLGLLTGKVTTDDLLQSIFSKFCIGK